MNKQKILLIFLAINVLLYQVFCINKNNERDYESSNEDESNNSSLFARFNGKTMWKKDGKQNKMGRFKTQHVFRNLGRRPLVN